MAFEYQWVDHIDYPEKTMYQMIRGIAEKYPRETAYEFYNRKSSYAAFLSKIDRAAAAFALSGIGQGDVITICMPNIPQALHAFYAADRIGAAACMIHPLSAQSEISFYLRDTGSGLIIVPDIFYEKVEAAVSDVGHPVRILVVRIQDELPGFMKPLYTASKGRQFMKFPNTDHAELWSRFVKKVPGNAAASAPEVSFDRNRTSVLLYSGGTSGTPKGIRLSDLNMNALALQCRSRIPCEFGPGISMLSCMPVFHGFGLGVNIHTILTHGGKCILMPSFNIKSYADMLIKKRPNFIAGVPTIFEALLHMPQMKGKKLDFLLGMFCGGDSLSVELKKKVDAFLKEHGASIQVQEGYGLTECVTASCLTPHDRYKENSIGLPFPDTFYAIVKPGTDDALPPGEEGEIILSGPTVMLGYLNNPDETAHALRNIKGRTWLYTGDLGKMDEEGFVYFRQRIKRMIVTNGYNVYPGQLENVIDSCPEVAYSCVIGVKDKRRGQRVRAYVVLRDGFLPTDEMREKILETMRRHVAGYAIPREIEFRDELPKTLVGKVFYRKLEEEANAEAEA